MTFFGKIFHWIGQLFTSAKKEWLQVAVLTTKTVKDILNSPVTDIVAAMIPGKSDDVAIAFLRKIVPQILAKELAIMELTDASTEAEIEQAMRDIVAAFTKLSDDDKAELYTKLAAKIYMFTMREASGDKVSFGEAAALVESAYQTWLKAKENDDLAQTDLVGGRPDDRNP